MDVVIYNPVPGGDVTLLSVVSVIPLLYDWLPYHYGEGSSFDGNISKYFDC